jgi:hypothetical protein
MPVQKFHKQMKNKQNVRVWTEHWDQVGQPLHYYLATMPASTDDKPSFMMVYTWQAYPTPYFG